MLNILYMATTISYERCIILQDASPDIMLRLLLIYACVYPEKFEGDKGTKLMQVVLNPY